MKTITAALTLLRHTVNSSPGDEGMLIAGAFDVFEFNPLILYCFRADRCSFHHQPKVGLFPAISLHKI
jgi:hypothetical protein